MEAFQPVNLYLSFELISIITSRVIICTVLWKNCYSLCSIWYDIYRNLSLSFAIFILRQLWVTINSNKSMRQPIDDLSDRSDERHCCRLDIEVYEISWTLMTGFQWRSWSMHRKSRINIFSFHTSFKCSRIKTTSNIPSYSISLFLLWYLETRLLLPSHNG